MGTTILMVIGYILLGVVMLAFLAGISYAGVMLAMITVNDIGSKSIVGKVFAAVFGFLGGALCPFWWAVCLAAHN